MYRDRSRIVPIILILLVIAIAVIALISVGRLLFGGGNQSSGTTDPGRVALIDTSATHAVRMTVHGNIVADENYRSYQVTIDPNNRVLTTYSGYLDQVLNTKQLSNNQKAYEEFVYALDKAGMMNGTELTGDKDDTRGICADGRVYEFEVLSASDTVKHLWTSTCKNSSGSLTVSPTLLQSLVLDQIPDNQKVLSGIRL
jgi:hypothetical protein